MEVKWGRSREDVIDIRTAHANGFTVSEISSEFGVKYRTVYDIVTGKTFKNFR